MRFDPVGMIYTIFYGLLLGMFTGIFSKKRQSLATYQRALILITLIAVDFGISTVLTNYMLIKVICILVTNVVAMKIYFDEKVLKIIIFTFLYQAVCFVTDCFSLVMMNALFSVGSAVENNSTLIQNLLVGSLSQLLLFSILLVFNLFFKHKSIHVLTRSEWIRFSIFPVFTIFSLIMSLQAFKTIEYDQKLILLFIVIGMLIMNILVFWLIYDITNREMRIQEDNLFRERVNNELSMYHQISATSEAGRKREHEFKNHIAIIYSLAKTGETARLNAYLDEYNKEASHYMDSIDTNHVIVNAILNTKYQEAKEKGFVVVLKVNDLSNLPISDEDIVVILSNLLNNAIEAGEKCDEKLLKIKFVHEDDQIIISVINSYAEEPIADGDTFQTTKSDKQLHGIGIHNIKNTVQKYGGESAVRMQDHMFQFTILI